MCFEIDIGRGQLPSNKPGGSHLTNQASDNQHGSRTVGDASTKALRLARYRRQYEAKDV